MGKMQIWKWQKVGRIYLAGGITLVTGLIIWITSLPFMRRTRFQLFYNIHHFYIIFLVFFLFHAGDRHFYMIFPGVLLFGLDKLSLVSQKIQVNICQQALFSSRSQRFQDEVGESEFGVVVCGPESMKESVALACQQCCKGKNKKPTMSFQSLNFTL
ncbi:hypothetical protein V2J09_000416 [Rumex salicifolius]